MSIFENSVMIKSKRSPMNLVLIVLMFVGIVVFSVLAVLLFEPLLFFVAFGAAAGAFALLKYGDLEHEYIWIEGQLDIDRIYGKSRRKNMARIDAEELLLIAPEGSGELTHYEQEASKRLNCSSRIPQNKKYKVAYNSSRGITVVTFEPDQNLLDLIRVRNGRKVIV